MICTDGVYAALPGERPRFYPLAPPEQRDVVWVAKMIAIRIQPCSKRMWPRITLSASLGSPNSTLTVSPIDCSMQPSIQSWFSRCQSNQFAGETSMRRELGRISCIITSCSACGYGSGRSKSRSTIEKIAVFVPIPKASVKMTVTANSSVRSRPRTLILNPGIVRQA
jgi:hypothetical protein